MIPVRFSPDGEWIAYTLGRIGPEEIYVQPFPDGGARDQISKEGRGVAPVWSPDGRGSYYRSPTEQES